MSSHSHRSSGGESMKASLLLSESSDSASAESIALIDNRTANNLRAPNRSPSARSPSPILKVKGKSPDSSDSSPSASRSVSFSSPSSASSSSRSRGVSFAPAVTVHVFHYSKFDPKTKEYSQFDDPESEQDQANAASESGDTASAAEAEDPTTSLSSPSRSSSSPTARYSYRADHRDFEYSHPLIEPFPDLSTLCRTYWCTRNVLRLLPSIMLFIVAIFCLISLPSNGWGRMSMETTNANAGNTKYTLSSELGLWESCATIKSTASYGSPGFYKHQCVKLSISELSECSKGSEPLQAEFCTLTILARVAGLFSTLLAFPTLIITFASLFLYHRCYTVRPQTKLRWGKFAFFSAFLISILQLMSFGAGLRAFSSLWSGGELFQWKFGEIYQSAASMGFTMSSISYSTSFCPVLAFLSALFACAAGAFQFYFTRLFQSRVKPISTEEEFSAYNYYNIYDWGDGKAKKSKDRGSGERDSVRREDIALERLNRSQTSEEMDDNDGL